MVYGWPKIIAIDLPRGVVLLFQGTMTLTLTLNPSSLFITTTVDPHVTSMSLPLHVRPTRWWCQHGNEQFCGNRLEVIPYIIIYNHKGA